MSALLRKHKSLIKLYPHLKKDYQHKIIDTASKPFIDTVSECCLNFHRLPRNKSKSLNKYKKLITFLSSKKNSLLSKKKILKQKGRGLLPLLFGLVGPLLKKLIS